MQSTSIAPWPVRCYLIPNHFHLHHHHHHHHHHLKRKLTTFFPFKNETHFTNSSFLTFSSTNSCSKEQEKKKKKIKNQSNSYPNHKHSFLEELYSFTDNNNQIRRTQNPEKGDKEEQTGNSWVIFTNMWWADLKAAFGQRFNWEGIVCSAVVVARDRHLALPHVAVPDIRYIDWAELQRRGFRGVVFDKDNTITAPYSLTLWSTLGSSLELCKSVFGDDIAVFSNSAGLYEYDPDGSKARALEKTIGIKVLRHRVKKPAGTAEEIEKHFGCTSSQLIMVGDRYLNDIVYGNRNGFLTILTEPLTLAEEPFIVQQVRKLEASLVNRWHRRGLRPTSHSLLPDASQCVKDPPPL